MHYWIQMKIDYLLVKIEHDYSDHDVDLNVKVTGQHMWCTP